MGKLMMALLLITGYCTLLPKDADQTTVDDLDSGKTLILYLSRTNNTKAIAQMIHQEIGGDLVALKLVNPYPEEYDAIVKQVQHENDTGFLPPLKTKIDLSKYDTVFLGFPTWGMQLPPPLKSFLKHNSLGGKTVIPFNSHAGYGAGSSFETVKELCPNSTILEGFSTKGGIERDGILFVMKGEKALEVEELVREWLKKIYVLKPNHEIKRNNKVFNPDDMMIRIAELEIDSNYLDEYISILKKEAAESVKLEAGVLCIYPMFEKENPTKIRLLEIYADESAYQAHLQTPHFKYYKTTTLNMVKSLNLIDMEAIDKETMSKIFSKLKQH